MKSALSRKIYKLTSKEIQRYRTLGAPLPRTAYDERIEERAKRLGGTRLFARTCAKTGKPIRTTIPPDAPLIVWEKNVYESEFA